MVSTLSCISGLYIPSCRTRRFLTIRCQSFKDEGSSNIEDANLSVLRGRIEVIKIKEKLKKKNRYNGQVGWNYQLAYDCEAERECKPLVFTKVVGVIWRAFGACILSFLLCLCFVSLMVHMILAHMIRSMKFKFA